MTKRTKKKCVTTRFMKLIEEYKRYLSKKEYKYLKSISYNEKKDFIVNILSFYFYQNKDKDDTEQHKDFINLAYLIIQFEENKNDFRILKNSISEHLAYKIYISGGIR